MERRLFEKLAAWSKSEGRKPLVMLGVPSKAEVEFVGRAKSGEVVPIEVKSGKNVRSKSLAAFREKYRTDYAVRISARNFGEEGGIRSVPLYAAWLLGEELL